MLAKLRSTAVGAHGVSTDSGCAKAAAARRSFSLRKNLSQHLDLGTPAVPASTCLPPAGVTTQAGIHEGSASPLAPAQSDTTDEEQVCSPDF